MADADRHRLGRCEQHGAGELGEGVARRGPGPHLRHRPPCSTQATTGTWHAQQWGSGATASWPPTRWATTLRTGPTPRPEAPHTTASTAAIAADRTLTPEQARSAGRRNDARRAPQAPRDEPCQPGMAPPVMP